MTEQSIKAAKRIIKEYSIKVTPLCSAKLDIARIIDEERFKPSTKPKPTHAGIKRAILGVLKSGPKRTSILTDMVSAEMNCPDINVAWALAELLSVDGDNKVSWNRKDRMDLKLGARET